MPIIFELKVTPSSGRAGFVLDKSGMIKCFLKSPAEDGRANRELIKLISQAVKVPHDEITILQGLTSRKKRIKINRQLTEDELFVCLGLIRQQKLF